MAAATEPDHDQPGGAERAPATCARVGRSRRTAAAITIVSTTCAWSTSPARPAGMPAAIAV